MSVLLKIENLTCRRSDSFVFSDINFELNKGQNIEVIGSNGSGKTTLLRCILGLIPEVEGKIYWKGKNVNDSRISFLKSSFYQGHHLGIKSEFSVKENLEYSHFAFDSNRDAVVKAASRLGLGPYLQRKTSELSVGQKKRIAIARWLITELDLFLIDEPFTALDDEASLIIHDIVKELNLKGVSFLITGHRPSNIKSTHIYLKEHNED